MKLITKLGLAFFSTLLISCSGKQPIKKIEYVTNTSLGHTRIIEELKSGPKALDVIITRNDTIWKIHDNRVPSKTPLWRTEYLGHSQEDYLIIKTQNKEIECRRNARIYRWIRPDGGIDSTVYTEKSGVMGQRIIIDSRDYLRNEGTEMYKQAFIEVLDSLRTNSPSLTIK